MPLLQQGVWRNNTDDLSIPIVLGSLIGTMVVDYLDTEEKLKHASIRPEDIARYLRESIAQHEDVIKRKRDAIAQLEQEIEVEESSRLRHYRQLSIWSNNSDNS